MNLADLILELKKSPPADYLRIDRSPVGLQPNGLDSYRGYYDQAAIGVECERYGANVGEFVKLLESRIGQTMTGYKGGNYTITPDTKVWISNYGECSDTYVTGVRREDWGCTFIKWEKDE